MVVETALVLEDVHKYISRRHILKGVSFRVGEHEIYCIVGPNGAGKTTTLRIAAGLLRPSSGRVEAFGLVPWRDYVEYRRAVAYLPEEAGSYKHLTAEEYLRFVASIYYPDEESVEDAVRLGLEIAGLGDDAYRRMGGYSKGMKRLVQLARTLMIKPRIAILDEPTSGLDVYNSVRVRNAIRRYVEEFGGSVLLSSHNMLEVEYLCDKISLIESGSIIVEGSYDEILSKAGADNLEEAFIKLTGVETV